MIIRLESTRRQSIEPARYSIAALARAWDQEISEAAAESTPGAAARSDKGADPTAVIALVLSIPSTALAVLDLADRIRKRHRAQELISHAQHLASQQVTTCLIARSRTIELRTLTPDQLLDLIADDEAAS